jgi:hypothetical protein
LVQLLTPAFAVKTKKKSNQRCKRYQRFIQS